MTESQPLFPDGFKIISIYQLDEYFLIPFGENEQRKYLIDRFMAFVKTFFRLGVTAEVWIDGSFTTWKKEPRDVDLVFVLNKADIDALTAEKAILFNQLMVNREQNKIRYACDIHFFTRDDEASRIEYLKLFGLDRPKLNTKGIFVLHLGNATTIR